MTTSHRLKAAARAFLPARATVPPAELAELLDKTAAHLERCHQAGPVGAREAAIAAWSEAAAAECLAHVDLAASTPQLLVLVDGVTGQRRLFPVADLVRLLGPRSVAA